jgi:hypothetical protein
VNSTPKIKVFKSRAFCVKCILSLQLRFKIQYPLAYANIPAYNTIEQFDLLLFHFAEVPGSFFDPK